MTQPKKVVLAGLSGLLALLFLSCVVDSNEKALTDVTLAATATTIDATGSAVLTATVETVGSPTLYYTWKVKSGSSYATITNDDSTCPSAVLTGCNTDTSEHTVTVKVTVTDAYNGYSYSDSIDIEVGAAASVVSAVSISGTSAIAYNGSGTLTATAAASGNPSLTYTWKITSGSDCAYFGSAGTATVQTSASSVTITANNTTSSAKTVTVTVTATNDEDSTNTVTSSTYSISVTKYGDTVTDKIGSVSIAASKESISAAGSTTLTATTSGNTGSPTVTYSWQITDGSSYASLSATSGESVTLTGNNTESTSKTVTVQVTAINSADADNTATATQSITISATAVDSDTIYVNLTNGTVSADGNAYVAIDTSANEIATDIKVKFTEDDSGASTGLIRVNATKFSGDLTVNISGTMTTGGVKIQSNGSDTVYVNLNGATITSSSYPCVEVTKGSPAVVTLTGTNTFTDGRSYGTGYGEEYSTISGTTYVDDDDQVQTCTVTKSAVSPGSDSKGTLYSKGNLTITGTGSLKVTQAYKNCIATKEGILTINGGTFTLCNYTSSSNTGKNALFGGAGIVVNDGTITFNGKGIVSSSDIRKANGFNTDDDDYPSSSVTINGGTINMTTYNGKGITAPYVYITGGSNTFAVTGSTTYAEAGSNPKTVSGYDADGVSTTITLKFAAEGIEGASQVKISGGSTTVTATDDAVNVSSSSGTFYLTGGSLYTYSTGGDGIDCNGNIYIQGGTVVSYAPTGSEDAFDCGDSNNKIYITGGLIAGVCGSSNAASDISTSGQKALYFAGSSSSGGGGRPGQTSSSSTSFSKVAVYVSGSCVYAFTLPSSSFGLCLLSSPSFTSSNSSSYTVYTSPTFSGGTAFNGLYTTLPTVTAGSSTKTPSIK